MRHIYRIKFGDILYMALSVMLMIIIANQLSYNLNLMSLDISSSHQPTQDSFLSIELATHSYNFTPIMELQGGSESSSGLHPRVLLFADHLKDLEANIRKKSIQLFYGSRIYESFEVKHDNDHSESLEVRDFEAHCLRNEQLFPSNKEKVTCSQPKLENQSNQSTPISSKPRKNSVEYFCDQLAQLKLNVNKLITIINVRNPQQNKSSPIGCPAPHPSYERAANLKQSIDAKSTKSQQMKDNSRHISRCISRFESPAKRSELGLHDVSPIPHRDETVQFFQSNVNESSSSSLMRRKMKGKYEASSNSA